MPALDAQQRYAYETMRGLTEDHLDGHRVARGGDRFGQDLCLCTAC